MQNEEIAEHLKNYSKIFESDEVLFSIKMLTTYKFVQKVLIKNTEYDQKLQGSQIAPVVATGPGVVPPVECCVPIQLNELKLPLVIMRKND